MSPVGGARVRSGPQPDPNSLKSDRLKRGFRALPAEGYAGDAPPFPLPGPTARERAVWAWAWTQPQAVAWAEEGAWRADMVAEWVRMKVRAESRKAPASLTTQAIALRHQIGLTPAGLRENGWTIAPAVAAAVPEQPAAPRSTARDRLRVVDDAADGA